MQVAGEERFFFWGSDKGYVLMFFWCSVYIYIYTHVELYRFRL